MKKIGIIIINFHGEKDTEELLFSLSKLDNNLRYEIKIYIVDNSSTFSEYRASNNKILSLEKDKFTIIKNKKNNGFAAANNQGINSAIKDNCDYVCLLNNDTTVSPDFLNNLFIFFEKNKTVAVASPKIYFSKGREFRKEKYKEEEKGKVIWYAGGIIDWRNIYCSHRGVDEVDNGQYDEIIETDFATGCAMFLRKEIFEKIGYLNAKYFAYFEDVDFCVRARNAGFEIKYFPKSVIWHKNASSSGGSGSSLQFFLQERNRIYFGLKYANLKVKILLIKKALQYFFSKHYKITLSLIKICFN